MEDRGAVVAVLMVGAGPADLEKAGLARARLFGLDGPGAWPHTAAGASQAAVLAALCMTANAPPGHEDGCFAFWVEAFRDDPLPLVPRFRAKPSCAGPLASWAHGEAGAPPEAGHWAVERGPA